MMPIAFNQNNSLLLNNEAAVVLLLAFILCITGTIYNIFIHKSEKTFFQSFIVYQVVISMIAVISFAFFMNSENKEKDNIQQLMIVQIQEKHKIENLQPTERINILCNDEYSESINSMVWSEKDGTNQIGVLIGQKVDDECRFILEGTIAENPSDKLKKD